MITCALHVPDILAAEVRSMGKEVHGTRKNGVETEGTLEDCMRLNLCLRTAWRVQYRLGSFRCSSINQLYEGMKSAAAWEEIIDRQGYFSVSSFAAHPAAKNSMYVNQLCKDAIADYFKDKYGSRPDAGKEKNRTVVFVYWNDNRATVYLDTSGEPLDRRGYRQETTSAPLQETLAAACLLSTGWQGDTLLVNPMCGSGTLAVEAALMATGRVPGLLRDNFGFMHISGFDPAEYSTLRKSLQGQVRKPAARIIATDRHHPAIGAAQRNAHRAGVDELIDFKTCPFEETPVPDGPGLVIMNPPYGERLGEEEMLKPVYAGIGDFLKNSCGGKTGAVLAPHGMLAKAIRLSPKRKIPLLNGKIDCRLMVYEMYSGSRRKE